MRLYNAQSYSKEALQCNNYSHNQIAPLRIFKAVPKNRKEDLLLNCTFFRCRALLSSYPGLVKNTASSKNIKLLSVAITPIKHHTRNRTVEIR